MDQKLVIPKKALKVGKYSAKNDISTVQEKQLSLIGNKTKIRIETETQ